MGKIVIANGLGAANAGGTISARLSDGRVVQAKAGAAISTSKVIVMEDESGQFHAFPEAPSTGAVTTRQIYRSKRKPAPALILDDYFFKVLQPSSIEGFDADINLSLTGYEAGVIANNGAGYVALLLDYSTDTVTFRSDTGSVSISMASLSGVKSDSFIRENIFTAGEYVSFSKPGAGDILVFLSSKFSFLPGEYDNIQFFNLESPSTTTTQIEVYNFDGADYDRRNLVYSNTSTNITAPGGTGFNLPQRTLDAVLREKSRQTLTTYFISNPISGYSIDTKIENSFWETLMDFDDRKEYVPVDEYSYSIDTVRSFDYKHQKEPVNYIEYYASVDHPVIKESTSEEIGEQRTKQYYFVAKRVDYTHTWTWTNQTSATTSYEIQSSYPRYEIYFKDVLMGWGYFSDAGGVPVFDPVVVERFSGQVGGNAYLTAYIWVIALTPTGASGGAGSLGTDWTGLDDSIETVSRDLYYTFNDTIIFYEYPRASTPSKATTTNVSYVSGFGFQLDPMFSGLKSSEYTVTSSKVSSEKLYRTIFLIQRNNICLYFYQKMDSFENHTYSQLATQTIDPTAPWPYLVYSESSNTFVETGVDNEFADLVLKTNATQYVVKDLIGNTLDFGDRFYLYSSSTLLIGASFSLPISFYSIGVKNSNYGNYTKVPKKIINDNGVFTIEYYGLTPFTFVGKDVYIFQRVGGGLFSLYEGAISAESFALNTDGNHEFRSHNQVTLSAGALIEQTYLGGNHGDNCTIVISKTDFTSFIVDRILSSPENVNLYTIDGTVELAVSQAPETTDDQDEWRADIYRFNTTTLKWERQPNAVSSLSQLSAVSSYISYHPDPSG